MERRMKMVLRIGLCAVSISALVVGMAFHDAARFESVLTQSISTDVERFDSVVDEADLWRNGDWVTCDRVAPIVTQVLEETHSQLVVLLAAGLVNSAVRDACDPELYPSAAELVNLFDRRTPEYSWGYELRYGWLTRELAAHHRQSLALRREQAACVGEELRPARTAGEARPILHPPHCYAKSAS